MKKTFAIFLSALVILTSCGSITRHNYVLLIDNSRSVSDETLNRYIAIIQENILPNLGRYDRMTIQFIDECTLTKTERVFDLDLSLMDFAKRNDGMNHQKDSTIARMRRFMKDSIQPNIKSIILAKRLERSDCGNYTDIINAINESTPLITHNKSYNSTISKISNDAQGKENYSYTNIILIFSDMVNENRDKTMDFTEMGKYNEEKVLNKVEEVRNLKKIPDLTGCEVFIYGATSTSQAGSFANRQIENCKIFWQTFFNDCGAELKAYSYDSKKEIVDFLMAEKKL